MKIYSYSEARARLSDILEESKNQDIVIKRRKGDMFSIVPKETRKKSPFDVAGLKTQISKKEIVEAIQESRQRK